MDTQLWSSLLTIVGVWLVTVLSPGPNFIATLHTSVSRSRGAGLLVAAGIGLGTTVWATAALLGLAVLFQTVGWIYAAAKYIGAAYLIYLGIRLLVAAELPAGGSAAAKRRAGGGLRAFRLGVFTDLSNPKAAAFFTSLFAVTVPPAAPLWFDVLIVLCTVGIAWGWYSCVAVAMATPRAASLYQRARRWVTRVAGVLFVGFGVRLAVSR